MNARDKQTQRERNRALCPETTRFIDAMRETFGDVKVTSLVANERDRWDEATSPMTETRNG